MVKLTAGLHVPNRQKLFKNTRASNEDYITPSLLYGTTKLAETNT